MKKIFNNNAYAFFLIAVIFSCDYKPASFGSFQKIVVFADSSLYAAVQTELEQTFDQYVYTPHTEQSFYLDLQPLHTFDTYKTRRNILFLGLLDGKDEVSSFITESLSAQVKESIRNNQIFEIIRPDLFSSDQIVIFLPGKDLSTLKSNLANGGNQIFEQLNKSYFERLEKAMFLKGEQLILEDYLADEFGWKIRIQHDYQVVKEEKENHLVWLRRLNPDRSLVIHRFPADKFSQGGEWIYNIRDSLTSAIFEGDRIDRDGVLLQIVEFGKWPAIKVTGIWQNDKHLIGGPFRTYAFHDEANKYVYMIDMSVTAPGKLKKHFLDQLEVMAKSFTLVR